MHVATYQDIDRLEMEIARLLTCSQGRSPAYTSTVSYIRFRSRLIGMVSSNTGSQPDDAVQLYLPQGLVVKCSSTRGRVEAKVGWEYGYCVFGERSDFLKKDAAAVCKGSTKREPGVKHVKKKARVL